MSEIKIEKNIPIPTPRTKWGFLKVMEVGDSVLLPEGWVKTASLGAIARYLRPKKFALRSTPDGYRVWRIQ